MERDLLGNRRVCDSERGVVERATKRPRRAPPVHSRRMEEPVDISMDSPEVQAWTKEAQTHPASDNRSSSRLRNAEFRALWGESGAGSSQPGPSTTEEPIRWNRVRRRSGTRAARPAVDPAGADDDVIFCPTPEETKYQSANDYRRAELDDFDPCSPPTAFDPLSLASFAARRPPSLSAAYQASASSSRWAAPPPPPPPRAHEVHPTTLDRSAAMYHHLPYRMRHHRPYEPFDTAVHHHSTRGSVTHDHQRPDPRQDHREDASVQTQGISRDMPTHSQGVEVLPPAVVPRRHSRRMPSSQELAERIAERRRRDEARDLSFNARAAEEAELRFRMDELEVLEAAFAGLDGPPAPPPPPPHFASANWRSEGPDSNASRSRASEGRGRRRGWGPGSLAEAMMGMLGDDALGGVPGGRNAPPHIAGHLSAMRAAFAGMSAGRLPAHLLFSDRDFNEDDYEALLALDDTVENRKGASKDIIEAIPTVPVPFGGLTETGDRRCPICLEDYVSGATLRRLHCSHQFHKPCLDKWLQQKATCPICQGDCKASV